MANITENTAPSLVVIGYCNHDVDRYPDGRVQKNVGGGGFFASQATTLVNDSVGFVSKAGQDFDLTPLQKRGLTKAVSIVSDGSTALSDHTYHDLNNLGDRSIKLYPGVNPSLNPNDIPKNWLSSSSGFLISTMIPEQQREFVRFIAATREELTSDKIMIGNVELKKPFIGMDTDLCWLQEQKNTDVIFSSISQVDILFCNRLEGQIFRQLFPKIPIVVLKKDEEGAEIYHFGQLIASANAPKVQVVNVTGAGDIFAGVFLGQVVQGKSIETALATAIKIASSSITKEGIEHLF